MQHLGNRSVFQHLQCHIRNCYFYDKNFQDILLKTVHTCKGQLAHDRSKSARVHNSTRSSFRRRAREGRELAGVCPLLLVHDRPIVGHVPAGVGRVEEELVVHTVHDLLLGARH